MSLILAHQELRQLEGKDSDVAASVISNPYSRVCFRLGDTDAKRLQSGFSFFEAQDLQSLGIGEAIVRVERAEYDFNIATPPLPKIDGDLAKDKARAITEYSRKKYGVPREEVEAFFGTTIAQPSSPKPREVRIDRQDGTESLQGRGGQRHKQLQQQIKEAAEQAGFKATIEKRLDGGTGHVDVALERDGLQVACEIGISTSATHEVANVEKCLKAGFDYVLCVAADKKSEGQLRNALVSNQDVEPKWTVCAPDTLPRILADLSDGKTRLHGYSVEVIHTKLSESQQERKQAAVYKSLGQTR